ncbi:MAG: hypothetical protein EZS28_053494, partial [Streblomastix strix]
VQMKDGVLASVDLSYDEGKGILTFTASGLDEKNKVDVRKISKKFNVTNTDKLVLVSYDKDKKEFELTYKRLNNTTYVESVNVEGLDEWKTFNLESNPIVLEKRVVKGSPDELSAILKISDSSDNILKKGDSTGALFVHGVASNIKAQSGLNVQEELDGIKQSEDVKLLEAKAYADSAVKVEKKRAKEVEGVIANNLSNEITRSTNKDNELTAFIDTINGSVETTGSIKKSFAEAKAYINSEVGKLVDADIEINNKITIITG